MKPGYQTSEFWLVVLGMVLLYAADAAGFDLNEITVTTIVGAPVAWAALRAKQKGDAAKEA